MEGKIFEYSMAKRSIDDADSVSNYERSAKRLRPNKIDRLSILSDELVLRALSLLPISDLVVCERCAERPLPDA